MNLRHNSTPRTAGGNWMARFRRPSRNSEATPTVAPGAPNPTTRSSAVSRKQVFFVFMTIVILASSCIYHLHVRFEGIHLGYEAGKERRAQTQLLLERRELRLELASLKEQRRIESEARQKLGMEIPSFERIVSINKRQRVVSVSGGAL